jgi:outer membrane immunogenic protein
VPGYGTAADVAQTMPAPAKLSPLASSPYNWTGLYVGGDGGYGWNPAQGTLTTAVGGALASYGYTANGPFAGGFIGGNFQFNRIVAGIEGDWQKSNLSGNNQQQVTIGAAGVFPAGPFTVSTTVENYGSIRGRLGVAFDRFLLFGTGGWAWGNYSTSYALFGSAPFIVNGDNTANGWTAGSGVEYAFTDNVFGRMEYRYSDLRIPGFVDVATATADAGHSAPVSDVRVGFAYKFAGGLLGGK